MEPRIAMAFALMAAMAVILTICASLYFRKRQQRKHRMMGRGKSISSES